MRHRSRHSRLFYVLVLLVLCMAPACKKKKPAPSPSTVARFAELKPQGTQRLAQVAKLAAKVKSLPQRDAPLSKKTGAVVFAVIGEDFLENPNKLVEREVLDLSDPTVSLCKYLVDPAKQVSDDDDVKNLESCARLEYAAVIRQSSFTPPAVSSTSTYTPGTFRGDVLVFHLATGELRGSYSLDVTQDDKLKLTGTSPNHEWEKQAMAYLRVNIRDAVLKKLLERVP